MIAIDAAPLDNPPPALTAGEQATAAAAAQAALGAGPKPGMSRDDAQKRITELKADPKYMEKYAGGDAASVKEFTDLHKTAFAPQEAVKDERAIGSQIQNMIRAGIAPESDVGKDLVNMLTGKTTITPETRRQLEAKRQALVRDRGFIEKYFAGDQEAARTMTTLSVMLAARVEEAA